MKKLAVTAIAISMTAVFALADDTNPNGAGGATVKGLVQQAKDAGVPPGQAKKQAGESGKAQGEFVSGLNRESNTPDR